MPSRRYGDATVQAAHDRALKSASAGRTSWNGEMRGDHNWCHRSVSQPSAVAALAAGWLAAASTGGGAASALLSPPNGAREMHIFLRGLCVKGPVSILFSALIQRLHIPQKAAYLALCLQPPTESLYRVLLPAENYTLHFSLYAFSNCHNKPCKRQQFFQVDNVALSCSLILFLQLWRPHNVVVFCFLSCTCINVSKMFLTFDKI